MGETIKLDVTLRAFVRRETSRRWSAVCPSIGVASQGTTMQDAKRCLEEAVQLWFESCVERGVLDQALREANFRPLPSGHFADDEAEQLASEHDILGEDFSIHVAIPAYRAAASA